MSKLYQCPYDIAIKCTMEYPCVSCEDFCEYELKKSKNDITKKEWRNLLKNIYPKKHKK